MSHSVKVNINRTARITGWSMIAVLAIGMASSFLISHGIDINLSADVIGTSENMLAAEMRLRAKAYLALFMFALDILILVGLFYILRKVSPVLSAWSFLIGISGAILAVLGAVYTMNVAHLGGNEAYQALASSEQRQLLAGLQATSDYTAFHLGLILTMASKAGFYLLFLRSGMLPLAIAGWGLFASVFAGVTILVRDFIPLFGHDGITAAFMLSHLLALISTGLYLGLKGVREV